MIEVVISIKGKKMQGGVSNDDATLEEITLSIAELEYLLDNQKKAFEKMISRMSGGRDDFENDREKRKN